MGAAVFLDRDGVLIEDVHLLTDPDDIQILKGVPQALKRLKEAGYMLIVVTNQPVVARGLISERDVEDINIKFQQSFKYSGKTIIINYREL